MNAFFDEESQKIIVGAKEEMFELKHPYVGSEHLLLSFLKREDLEVTKLLNRYGITYDSFYHCLIESVGLGSNSNEWFLFTPMLKKILINASNISRNKDQLVTPSCLFLAFLREGEGVANRILMCLNVDLDALYDCFISSNYLFENHSSGLLDQFSVNMNEQSSKYDPVIGREKEIKEIIQALLRKNKNNPLLIGEAGVGKTALVEELAKMISIGNVPFRIKNCIIYNLSMASLISGTKYRGEFEERFQKILDEVKKNSNIILFIDEVHTLIGAGGAEGAIDASNILKPYLARGEIKIIGATTIQEYSKWIASDRAFDRRFQKIYVEEPLKSDVKNILFQLKPIYEKFHHVFFSDSILNQIFHYSYQYFFYGKQPDKVIDFLDEVSVYVSAKDSYQKNQLYLYEQKINHIVSKKNCYILNHDFSKAKKCRSQEKKIRIKFQNYLFHNPNESSFSFITEDDLNQVLFYKTKIPLDSIMKDLVLSTTRKLKNEIIGQNKVIYTLQQYLINTDYLKKSRPLSILFVGNSGVGKSFLAFKLSKYLVGEEYYYVFPVNEYSTKDIFYQNIENRILLAKLEKHPFSVIVFDYIDQCSYSVLHSIMELMDSGLYESKDGKKYNFSKCIFIFINSSNQSSVGFKESESNYSKNFAFSSKLHLTCFFENVHSSSIKKYISNYCSVYHYDDDLFQSLFCYVINNHNYKKFGFYNINQTIEKYFTQNCITI